jgi:MFS family permease
MRRGLKILISSSFTYNIASASFGPLYAIFVEKIGGGILEASGVYAAQAITIGILIFLLGKIEDRIDKRKILILGYFMQFVGIASYIFVQNVAQLFVVQIYLGIAAAITIPAFDAFYSSSLDRGKESSEWSIWESGTRIIAALAAIAGGFIAAEFGFRYLFVWMAFFSGIAAFITLLFLRKKEYEKLFPPRF